MDKLAQTKKPADYLSLHLYHGSGKREIKKPFAISTVKNSSKVFHNFLILYSSAYFKIILKLLNI